MTALPLRDFSDAERARLEAIEAAPAAEESARERLAAALFEVTEAAEYDEWPDVTGVVQIYVYALADAALAVLSGPSSDAERVVERVLALADEYDEAAVLCERIATSNDKDYIKRESGDAALDFRNRSGAIRAAVAGD